MLNVAKINLSAIKENARKIKAILPRKTAFCAVIKAEAYGHGAVRTAEALHGVADCFAVALAEEGARLRAAGVTEDILVFNPVSFADYLLAGKRSLTVCVSSTEDIIKAERAGREIDKAIKTHLKINTGMNRGGISAEQTGDILSLYARCERAKPSGVYSHYGAPENDELFYAATKEFRKAARTVKSFNKNATAHLSASGGFLRGAYFDMVRIGILLYGYKPYKTEKISVRPAMKVFAPVLCGQKLKAGERLLYGEKRLEKDVNALITRYGYADGLPREPRAGDIAARCMDVSATEVSAEEINGRRFKKAGGYVCVMDNADRLAEKYGTISYEILTKCAARAEKIYTYESTK